MARDSQFTVKSMHSHPLKIDVVKFDGKNNFGMWRCKMKDALNAQNLEDTLKLQEKPANIVEKNWKKMNQMACESSNLILHKICSIM